MKNILFLFLETFSTLLFSQKTDSLHLEFPKKNNLVLGSKQENDKIKMLEWIPKGESWENYNLIVTMIVIKGGSNIPLELFRENQYKLAKEKTTGLKLTELMQNTNGEREWKLFKLEAKSYIDSKHTESQLYYLTKSEKDLYICISALKKDVLTSDFLNVWSKVFKESYFIP